MSAIQLIVNILLVITSIVLIISVLLQKGDSDGLAALGGGGSDSFLGKNKAATLQGKLATITKYSAGVFVLLALVMIFLR